MKNYLFGILLALSFLFACDQKEKPSNQSTFGPKVVEAHGYVVPKDSMAEPEVVIVKEIYLLKTPADKPVEVLTNTNLHLAGLPVKMIAGPPKVCTPGLDTFSLPITVPAIDSPFLAGIPEIVIAKDPAVKDENPDNFSSFNKLQGLKHNNVYSIIEDKSGNIWFGTYGGGITKYDGKSFTHFTDREGLSSNGVLSILEDNNGNLWIGTSEDGVNKYDGKSCSHFTEKEGISDNHVYTILKDHIGNLWFGTFGGVSKYDGKSFTHYSEKQGLSSNYVFCILEDHLGNLWFGTYDGVSKFDGKSFTNFKEKEGLANGRINSIIEDKDGNLWFGTQGGGHSGGLTKYDGKTFTNFSEKEGLFDYIVNCIHQDNEGNLWLGTIGGGVVKYDGNTFTYFTEKEGLPNNFILSILEDSAGKLWFGTIGGGVSKYDGKTFTHFTEKEGLSNNVVMSIVPGRQGNVWFGTQGGVSKYDGKSFIHFTEKQGLANNSVLSVLEDHNGNLWCGTMAGVSKFDGKSITYLTESKGLTNTSVYSVLEDHSGNIWFGTNNNGVSKYDGKSLTHFAEKEGLSNNFVSSILEDHTGNFWFGTHGGVTKYEPPKDGHLAIFTRFSEKEGLLNNFISGILEDKSGNLWFSSQGGGVYKYDGKSFTNFTEKEGLCDNVVFSMLEDRNENLWIGTRLGLSELTNKKLTELTDKLKTKNIKESDVFFRNYTYEDGFLGLGCNPNAIYEAKDGTIWIGTNDRLTVVHPNGVMEDTISPNIRLTGLALFNEFIPWASLGQHRDSILTLGNGVKVRNFEFDSTTKWYGLPDHLTLAHNNNFLTFNFIGITMNQPKKVKYQYKLVGMDENWSALSTRTDAPYGNLPPRDYIFKVKAMNNEGYWSKEAVFPFTIRPPWWASWWAYILYVLMGGSIVYTFYRNRIRQLEIKQATKIKTILSTQEEERKRIATDLHDTIGSTLSSISIYSAAAEHMKSDQFPEVLSTIKLIGQNTRTVMENMSDIVWAINPANDTFQNMMERLQIFSVQLLEAKDIQLRFDVPEAMQSIKLSLPQRKNIYLILREAIHNVAKYSKASLCVVSAKMENKKIDLEVIDDGTGFDEITPGLGGNGIINMRQRADELKAFFQIQSEKEKGTRVSLQLAYS